MNKIAIYNKILVKIKQYDTIIIHRHIRPDGDCIGSQMGLKELLKASFPQKRILTQETIFQYLSRDKTTKLRTKIIKTLWLWYRYRYRRQNLRPSL